MKCDSIGAVGPTGYEMKSSYTTQHCNRLHLQHHHHSNIFSFESLELI